MNELLNPKYLEIIKILCSIGLMKTFPNGDKETARATEHGRKLAKMCEPPPRGLKKILIGGWRALR